MRSSLDYAGFAQLCGRSTIMRAHNRIIPRSLVHCTLCIAQKLPLLPQPSQFTLAWHRHQIMLACIPGGQVGTNYANSHTKQFSQLYSATGKKVKVKVARTRLPSVEFRS